MAARGLGGTFFEIQAVDVSSPYSPRRRTTPRVSYQPLSLYATRLKSVKDCDHFPTNKLQEKRLKRPPENEEC